MSQPNVETLTVKIGLSGTYWDRAPAFSVLLDGVKQTEGTITSPSGVVQYIEFTADLAEEQEHLLEIRLDNKTCADTVENEDKTAIVKDMLLNVESIEIDDIDLDQLTWTASEFVSDDPANPVIKNCVNLGWTGAYKLKFNCPFYLWLLESM